MKPLLVLLISFLVSSLAIRIAKKEFDLAQAGRIAMAIMLICTAIGHFVYTKGMSMMIPDVIPFKESFVHLTGVFEIVMAIGLLIPRFQYVSGWVLIVFLVLMLPANIYAAVHKVNYQTGTFDGHGLAYLWFRIPLQILFIAWAYFSSIKI